MILMIFAAICAWIVAQALPGPEVDLVDSVPSRSAPTDTGVGFMVGVTEKGPALGMVSDPSGFATKFGARLTWSLLSDSAETFFREGGSALWISRVFGPNPLVATIDLPGAGGAGTGLRVDASSAGDWANGYHVIQAAGTDPGTKRYTVHDADGNTVASVDNIATNDDAVAWAANTQDVRFTALTADVPVDADVVLAGGTDDHANATDVQVVAAINAIPKDIGPGQIAAPGRTTNTVQAALQAHALANSRVSVGDAIDSTDAATLITQARALTGLSGDRFASLFAPWHVIPGLLPGQTRIVPPCAAIMGVIARNDGAGVSVNQPSAGDLGIFRFVQSLAHDQEWSDTDRQSLNEAGVNVCRVVLGAPRIYGYRSLADQVSDADWSMFSGSRIVMRIRNLSWIIAESEEFKMIDGRGHEIKKYEGKLIGMLLPMWQDDELFGDTAQDAFLVDTDSVNTIETLSAGQLKARLALKTSPFAEKVIVQVGKVPPEEVLA